MRKMFTVTIILLAVLSLPTGVFAKGLNLIGPEIDDMHRWFTLASPTPFIGGLLVLDDNSTDITLEYYKEKRTYIRYLPSETLEGSMRLSNGLFIGGSLHNSIIVISPGYEHKLSGGKGHLAGSIDLEFAEGSSGVEGFLFDGVYKLDSNTLLDGWAYVPSVGGMSFQLQGIKKLSKELTIGGGLLSIGDPVVYGGLTYDKDKIVIDGLATIAGNDLNLGASLMYRIDKNLMIGGEFYTSNNSSIELKLRYVSGKTSFGFAYDIQDSRATLSLKQAF